jgi:hypothetical protein
METTTINRNATDNMSRHVCLNVVKNTIVLLNSATGTPKIRMPRQMKLFSDITCGGAP